MQTLQAVIMGVFQGLTEFLPVSSSGHIVLSSAFYKMLTGADIKLVSSEEIFFDILIHLSTLFVVIIYFWHDIKKIVKGFIHSLILKDYKNEDFKFGVYILSATLITGILGFVLKGMVQNLTENPFSVCAFIAVTGIILLFSENIKAKEAEMSLKTALITGFFQGLASIPGLSRSGLTISSAMYFGVKRFSAARFSFILSIPVILLASLIYPLITFDIEDIKDFNFTALISGMITSFVTGYLCIACFMRFLKRHTLKCFAYYCFIASTVSALIFYLNL